MQINILAFSFLFIPIVSCQQDPKQALSSASNLVLTSSIDNSSALGLGPSVATDIIFQSTDDGQSWQDISAGLPEKLGVGRISTNNGAVFLAAESKIFHSTNIGAATPVWQKEVFLEMENTEVYPGQTGNYIRSYGSGLFKNIPGTGVLIPLNNGLKDKDVRTVIETPDGAVFVGCESGIYKSSDGGNSWKQVLANDGINSFAAGEGVLICGTYKGLMRSTDGGEHWDTVLTEDGGAWKTDFFGGRFVAITQGAKSYGEGAANRMRSSSDGGLTWQRMDENLSSALFVFSQEENSSSVLNINDIKMAGQYLFCSCDAGIFRSADWGKSWEPVFNPYGMKMMQLGVSGKVIYAVKVVGC
ncbi:MAG: WD40/YVTN/BNR-like repeat-containing protein [Saprospiraceae bacterium]